jgi:hypothetical protein
MRVLAVLFTVFALFGSATCDAPRECAAAGGGDHDGVGATAMRTELDLLETDLAHAKGTVRALEKFVATQSARVQTMRALVSTPGVTCDESAVAVAEALTRALRARSEAEAGSSEAGSSEAGSRKNAHESSQQTRDYSRDGDPAQYRDRLRRDDVDSTQYRDVDPTRYRGSESPDSSTSSSHLTPTSYRPMVPSRDRAAVARRLDDWTDHLRLTGAARLEEGKRVTALVVLPQRSDIATEFPRYFAVGDSHGGVRVLKQDGDTAVALPDAFDSGSDSGSDGDSRGRVHQKTSVVAIAASYQRRNETVLLSGRRDGGVVFHQIFETDPDKIGDPFASGDAEWSHFERTLAGTVFESYSSLDNITCADSKGLANPQKTISWEKEKSKAARKMGLPGGAGDDDAFATPETISVVGVRYPQGKGKFPRRDDDSNSEKFVDYVHSDLAPKTAAGITAVHVFRLNDGKRYYAVADTSGKIVLFTDRGASVHSVYYLTTDKTETTAKTAKTAKTDKIINYVVSFKPSRRAVTFITPTGAGSVDPQTFVMRLCKCAKLDHEIKSVTFDQAHSSKFYAVTSDSHAVMGVVNGLDVGVGANTRATCVIRHKAKEAVGGIAPSISEDDTSSMFNSAFLATTKGFVFVSVSNAVRVLNVTGLGHQSGGVHTNSDLAGGKRVPTEIIATDVFALARQFGGEGEARGALIGESGGGGEDEGGDAQLKRSFPPFPIPIATDVRGRFVVVGLPGGFVGMYDSSLAVWRPEPINTKLWSQPLFVLAMIGVSVRIARFTKS